MMDDAHFMMTLLLMAMGIDALVWACPRSSERAKKQSFSFAVACFIVLLLVVFCK